MSSTQAVFKPGEGRSPTLDTILMVEEAIRKAGEYPTKAELYRSLPRQVMYQTFKTVLDYLAYSGKVVVDKDGAIVWVWDPEGVRRVLANKRLVAR